MDPEDWTESSELEPPRKQFSVGRCRPIGRRPMQMIAADIRCPIRNARCARIDPLGYLIFVRMEGAGNIGRSQRCRVPLLTRKCLSHEKEGTLPGDIVSPILLQAGGVHK